MPLPAIQDDQAAKKKQPLTKMEHAFVEAYLRPGETFMNGSFSAREAGYSKKGTAHAASRLLKRPVVAAAIKRHLEDSGATPERVISELCKMAFDTEVTTLFTGNAKVAAVKILATLVGVSMGRGRSMSPHGGGRPGVVVNFHPPKDLRDRMKQFGDQPQVPGIITVEVDGGVEEEDDD